MWSSHRTHFTPFCRVILAISFPYEQETLVGHQPSRNSHGREKFPHQLQTQQGQSAIYAFHHRKYKNLWPHLHIYTFLPKLIYAREKENSFSLQRATAKGDEERRKLFFSPSSSTFHLTLPVGWAADFSAVVVVAAVVQQQVWHRWKLTFQAVVAKRLSSNLSKINKRFCWVNKIENFLFRSNVRLSGLVFYSLWRDTILISHKNSQFSHQTTRKKLHNIIFPR